MRTGTPWARRSIAGARAKRNDGIPPCFYYKKCRSLSTCESGGKSVCDACAKKTNAPIYRLRRPYEFNQT